MGKRFLQMLKENYHQILLVFFAFLLMVLISFFYVSSIVRDQIETLGQEVMNTTQTAVTGALSETELMFYNAVQSVDKLLVNQRSNEEILATLRELNQHFGGEDSAMPEFLKVYGYIRGKWLAGSGQAPPADYDPESRQWYIGAVENGGEIYFTDPYLDAESGGICISFSQALYDRSDSFQGVFAIDLNLSRITEYVAQQQISNSGYGILVSDSFQIATHQNPDFVGADMREVTAEYDRLSRLLITVEDINAVSFTDYDGTKSVAFFRHIFNGWYIGIVTPTHSFYAQVYQMGIVLAAVGFVLMALLSSLLVRTRMEKQRAYEESRSKSSFLARMSHEMRTPMNAIIGLTEIGKKSEDIAEIHYNLGRISDAADHLLGVINDVLDMSKIEAGKLELSETDVSMTHILDKVNTVMELKFQEKNQTFTVDVAPEVPSAIVADDQRLVQVVINLLSNANKFTDKGGHIGLSIRSLGEIDGRVKLEFQVSDDGIGLTEEQLARLFHSFEQADNSISRRYGGSGLGLVISQRIVEMMQGTIVVNSSPGAGSTFTFTILVQPGQAQPEQAATPVHTNLAGFFAGRHILLAEDIPINQEIVSAMLEETGIVIDFADNGQQAIDLFAADPDRYELMFMDIHMPELDGYEAAKQIRAMNHKWAKKIPIIAMTADVFLEDIQRATSAGMNGHIGKPISLSAMLEVLSKHLL